MNLPPFLVTLLNLALVIGGFGFIIFVHELGHFLAARWAGIRVLAFAVGFGPALVSFRKGLGVRTGSSEWDYLAWREAERAAGRSPDSPEGQARVSPTEYRLNALPFGGYVKMLGQEDLNPGAVSAESDSYQSTRPWKRMVVISAGVVMNAVLAAVLFVVVFMIGYETEPARIGAVVPGTPASKAAALNGREAGVDEPGLRPGDEVVLVNGRRPDDFSDLSLASAMSARGRAVMMTVRREGVEEALEFAIVPEAGALSGLLELGLEPMRSPRLFDMPEADLAEQFSAQAAELGLPGLEPGMTLIRAGNIEPVRSAHDLETAMRASAGQPVIVEFEKAEPGVPVRRVRGTLTPRPELEIDLIPGTDAGVVRLFEHLCGLTPVMRVEAVSEEGQGKLRVGDVFARLGELEFPNLYAGIDEIRRHKGRPIEIVTLNDPENGIYTTERASTPEVSSEGRIGFAPGDTARESTLLALPPTELTPVRAGARPYRPAAHGVVNIPGSRILSVAGEPVADFAQVRGALLGATASAFDSGADAAEVEMELELPRGPAWAVERPRERVMLTLTRDDLDRLHALSWTSPLSPGVFEPAHDVLKGGSPGEALAMGLRKTRQVMMSTYVTFLRLFQGTVKVEHLKGPVGIAHLGTLLAERGWVWLMFFMALVSINLAVINFLPLPIVDGGQFVFLLIEQATGRPVPAGVQNAAALAGMLLIGAVFLMVTFNDIRNLIAG